MKIAKLEMKLILAMMLLGYEYELVDGNGNYPKAIPDQDRNDLLQVSSPVHFKLMMWWFIFLFSRALWANRVIWNTSASLSEGNITPHRLQCLVILFQSITFGCIPTIVLTWNPWNLLFRQSKISQRNYVYLCVIFRPILYTCTELVGNKSE